MQPKLLFCGYNVYSQFAEKSNNKSNSENEIISPPVESSFDVSTISCFTLYSNHIIIITKNGEIFGSGDNSKGEIIGLLPKEELTKFTKFEFKDENNQVWHPISAAACSESTIFLISSTKDNTQNKIAYSYMNIPTTFPVFQNVGESNPISLYSGFFNAAAIDSEGSILYFPQYYYNSPQPQIDPVSLPNNEKAIGFAFCNDHAIALSKNGCVFISEAGEEVKTLNFTPEKSLEGKKIVQISGISDHCFALTEDGKVFCRGAIKHGKLGLGKNIQNVKKVGSYMEEVVDEFVEVTSLNKYNIKAVYAGVDNSLFQTVDGKILACGENENGELFTDKPYKDDVDLPIDTLINEGASFCCPGF